MSKDVISDIKKTEDQAEQIHKDAMEKANLIVQEASIDAEDIHASIIKKAEEDGQTRLEETRRQAEEQIKGLREENDRTYQELKSSAERRMDAAATFIRERIVTNGNS
ncbi:MAG TPA: hypothetical protein VFD33_03995 [Bacillota bacterium]|nr:hypothetical protein [Bacillota bacterium]